MPSVVRIDNAPQKKRKPWIRDLARAAAALQSQGLCSWDGPAKVTLSAGPDRNGSLHPTCS